MIEAIPTLSNYSNKTFYFLHSPYTDFLAPAVIHCKSKFHPSKHPIIFGIPAKSLFFCRLRKRLWHICHGHSLLYPDCKVVLGISCSHQDETEESLIALKITLRIGWVSDLSVSCLLLWDTWDRTTASNFFPSLLHQGRVMKSPFHAGLIAFTPHLLFNQVLRLLASNWLPKLPQARNGGWRQATVL